MASEVGDKAVPCAESNCENKHNKSKNRVNLGMSQHIVKGFNQRIVWNSACKIGSNFDQGFGGNKTEDIRWFNTSKAFDNVYDGRTYSQVATKAPAFSHSQHANHGNNEKGTNTITVR